MAAVAQQAGGRADFAVRVCRSSEGETSDLHVDAGAVTMRLEQDDAVVWRLPLSDEPAAVLKAEPGGCWSWTYAWNGRGSGGEPVADRPAALHVASLSDEVRGVEDQEQFTPQS
jgi:hypothetical protein